MEFTKKQITKYLKDGCCPFCGSEEVHCAEQFQSESPEAWCKVKCLKCEHIWHEVFTMTTIEKIDA